MPGLPEALALELPPIPKKRYFSIGEVSQLCQVRPHVLRYWEQQFPQLKPLKRQGNRRYYQQRDILLVRRIRHLLYGEGLTIQGVGAQLRAANSPKAPEPVALPPGRVEELVKELEEIAGLLR